MTMNRAEFEADLRREGYELREGEIEPNVHRGSHAHEFDARLFVLEGSLTLVFGAERCTYRPGDSCNVRQERCTKSTPRVTACGTWPGAGQFAPRRANVRST